MVPTFKQQLAAEEVIPVFSVARISHPIVIEMCCRSITKNAGRIQLLVFLLRFRAIAMCAEQRSHWPASTGWRYNRLMHGTIEYSGKNAVKPELVRIALFPIKSLDGVVVETAEVLPGGALAFDRRWRMVDRQGRTVNGKRTAAVHRVAARFDVERQLVWLDARGGSLPRAYHLVEEWPAIQRRLSELLDIEVMLIEDAERGFPDDTDAPGPTLVSTATLETVASWFDGLSLDQVRARFRANLEIGGVPAFWEDRLVGEAGVEIPFAIGSVKLSGVKPCARCIVPTRCAETGESTIAFAPIFSKRRERTLPDHAPRSRFNDYYRLAVNTRRRPPLETTTLRIGDQLVLE